MGSATTTDSGWQLRGSAAAAYQEYLVPAIFDRMSRRLVAAAGIGPGERVLDVACGTGVVARAAAAAVGPTGNVTGVDVNRDMLATAEQASVDVDPAIRFTHADAADLPFDDGVVDTVLCEEAVQFFPDPVAALREMRRVAAPQGRVAFSVLRSLDHHPVYAAFVAALREHAGEQAAMMMSSPFALGDADELRRMASDAGLRDVTVRITVNEERFPSVEQLVLREAASSPLAAPLGELDADRRAALVAALAGRIESYVDDAGVAFHNETHIVLARP